MLTIRDTLPLLTLAPLAATLLMGSGCGIGTAEIVGSTSAELDTSTISRLDLDVERGDTTILGSPDATAITVEVDLLSTMGSRERRSQEVLSQLRVDLVDIGDGIATLDIALPDDADTYTLDVRVSLPAGMDLEAQLGSGNLFVSDVGSVDLCDDSGDATLERLAGDARICDGSGELRITDVQGRLEIDDDSGDLDVARIVGDVFIDDASGELTVQDVQGDVSIVDDSGDIDVEYVAGDVDVDDGSGDIRVAHVTGTVLLRDGSGDITLDDVGQYDVLDDGSGDLSVD